MMTIESRFRYGDVIRGHGGHSTASGRAYKIFESLGKGGFAVVFKAQDLADGKLVAIKVIDKLRLTKIEYSERQEIEIHSQLDHENIVTFHGAWSDNEFIYIVIEYCGGGDLNKELQRRGQPFRESESRRILSEIASGLKYLHSNRIIHRDINMANIFLTESGKCKIGDFGLARLERPIPNTHQTLCGTPSSIAPEVASRCPYSRKVDVWGLGIILYTILIGKSPFDDGKFKSTMDNVIHKNPHLPQTLSASAIHLINGMLQKEDSARMSLDEVLKHDFLHSSKSFTHDSGLGNSNMTGASSNLTSGGLKSRFVSPEIRKPLSEISELPDYPFRPISRARSATSNLQNGGDMYPLSQPIRTHSESYERLYSAKTNEENCSPAAATSTTTSKSLQLKSRLNTARIKTTDRLQDIKEGVRGGILTDGWVQFEFEITKKSGRKAVERITVSGNGGTIRIERRAFSEHFNGDFQEYSYETLPKTYFQKYNVIAHFVQSIRENLPKITMFTASAECKLMENEPDANFHAKFYNGIVIKYDGNKNRITYRNDNRHQQEIFSYPLTQSDLEKFPILQEFNAFHTECKEHAHYFESRNLWERFPITLGRRRTLKSSGDARSGWHPSPSSTMVSLTSKRHEHQMTTSSRVSEFPALWPKVSECGTLKKRYTFADSSSVIMDMSQGKPYVFNYIDSIGREKTATAGEYMYPEMKEKVLKVMQFIKNNSGTRSQSSHRSSSHS